MIRMPFRLSLYVAKHFLVGMSIVLSAILLLIVLVDAIELARNLPKEVFTVPVLLKLVLMRLPQSLYLVFPFVILIGSMFTFLRLTKHQEMVVIRASGLSVWEFLLPVLATSFIIGVFMCTAFSHFSSYISKAYEKAEAQYFHGQSLNLFSVSESGLWLREHGSGQERVFIHASRISDNATLLHNVLFLFLNNDRFIKRIDAKEASLVNNEWHIAEASITSPETPKQSITELVIPTSIVLSQLQDRFSSPKTISFFELPSFIKTLQDTGFSAIRHRLHLHYLIGLPFLYAAMVFIGGAFAFTQPRHSQTARMVVLGMTGGFLFYYISGLISALGESGALSVVISSWSPIAMTLFLGTFLMFHLESR